ncbi:unnamed protein product [Candidula unifasciata]|uniref:Uncharacterized protein n=1 Tax=Candidula unifasciata TaxID=100452 RepID=A0A8S3Z9U0_9EUPU|nr:unnamed protein product [Candidula unifasciata]
MEGLRKILPKSGSTIDKKSETSQESIPIPMSARSKLSRLRQKIRMMSNMRGSKVLDRQQTNVAYDNTYKLEPDTANRFSTNKAEQVIHEVFEHYLRGKSYEHKVLPRLIKTLSQLIRDRVKAQGIESTDLKKKKMFGKSVLAMPASGKTHKEDESKSYIVFSPDYLSLFSSLCTYLHFPLFFRA